MIGKYPEEKDIKVEWTLVHTLIIVVVTLIVTGFLIYDYTIKNISWQKYLTILGLYVDIVGVLVASLKTPFYGIFHDGGEIEIKRQQHEKKFFLFGMLLIAIGMIFQVIGTLLH